MQAIYLPAASLLRATKNDDAKKHHEKFAASEKRLTRLTAHWFALGYGGNRWRRLVSDDLKKHFVALDHTQLTAGAFFDRLGTLLKITHFGIQQGIARLCLLVDLLLQLNLAIQIQNFQPAAFAQPQRVLQQQQQDH